MTYTSNAIEKDATEAPKPSSSTDWRGETFPRRISLRDEFEVLLRRIDNEDEDRLLTFFQGIPEEERFFLKDDVTSPAVIKSWATGSERAFALLALDSDRVVGEAALVRRRGKARSHLADVRVVVAQDFRHRGLGTALISSLCDVAQDSGLSGVLLEGVEDVQSEALAAADALGFVRLGRIYGGAIDRAGLLHDVVLLVMPLRRWRRSSAV